MYRGGDFRGRANHCCDAFIGTPRTVPRKHKGVQKRNDWHCALCAVLPTQRSTFPRELRRFQCHHISTRNHDMVCVLHRGLSPRGKGSYSYLQAPEDRKTLKYPPRQGGDVVAIQVPLSVEGKAKDGAETTRQP